MHEHVYTPYRRKSASSLPFYSQSHSRPDSKPVGTLQQRFGLRLRELRRSHNMTQLRMAIDFGIDRSFISDVERGQKSISLVFLEVIAIGLEMNLAELMDGL